jgi:hypothetical protein
MHTPSLIYVQEIKENIAALFVSVASYRVEEVGHDYITPDNRIHRPFCAKKGDAGRGIAKDVSVLDEDICGIYESFACEDLQEG